MAENWIDVSAHNCRTPIDWRKAAASGVKGAVIRAGYGNDASQQDTAFIANITGAIAAGLKTAVVKEYITSDEYKQITGENYTE